MEHSNIGMPFDMDAVRAMKGLGTEGYTFSTSPDDHFMKAAGASFLVHMNIEQRETFEAFKKHMMDKIQTGKQLTMEENLCRMAIEYTICDLRNKLIEAVRKACRELGVKSTGNHEADRKLVRSITNLIATGNEILCTCGECSDTDSYIEGQGYAVRNIDLENVVRDSHWN